MCIHTFPAVEVHAHKQRKAIQRQASEHIADIPSEKVEVLLRGVGTLPYMLILSENSACQVPICAVAA